MPNILVSYHFRKEYIKTGVFTIESSDTITDLSNSRSTSDYDDDFEFTNEEVNELIAEAEHFVALTEEYHKSR